MADVCPACERTGCQCPVCYGNGRAQERGYSTPCSHCREVLVTRLRGELVMARKCIEAADRIVNYPNLSLRFAIGTVIHDAWLSARAEFAKVEGEQPAKGSNK